MTGVRGERRDRDDAFTLLEILAVISIFALIAGLAMPNFSALHSRNLKQQAQRLVTQLELARQRSIVTGVPHRLYIDVDGSAYRVEWLASEKMAAGGDDWDSLPSSGGNGAPPTLDDSQLDDYGRQAIDLSPPTIADEADYRFPGASVTLVIKAVRLQRDLDLNYPGIALALELMDEIEHLRERLRVFE